MFPKGDILRFNKLNESIDDKVTVGYIDTADEGEDSLSMPVIDIINKKCYLTDVIFSKENLTITEDQIVAKVKELGVDYLFVETNKEGSLFINNLRKRLDIQILGIKNTTRKSERIWAQSGWVMENIIFKDQYESLSDYGKFMKELTGYLKTGKVKHDDAPDSLAGLAKIIRTRYAALMVTE
jgi:predicted phage terminase large subunit-like protein